MTAWNTQRPKDYDHAITQAAVVTLRVKCINKELGESVSKDDPLSAETRATVCKALDHHLVVCEGMTPDEARETREAVPTVRPYGKTVLK